MRSITITEVDTMSWDEFTTCFRERSSLGPQYGPAEGSVKKPKIFNLRAKGQQGQNHCGKCGKSHEGCVDLEVYTAKSLAGLVM